MRERRVVVLDTGYDSYAGEERLLEEAGYTLELFEGERGDKQGKIAFAKGAAGLFVRWTVLDGGAFDAMPTVKAVVRYGVGYENVDLAAASRRGIMVSNVQGYANHSVSDHTLALIFACLRNLKRGGELLRPHYLQPPRPSIPEVKDMTLGIIGLGRIGGTLAGKARHLFARVLACDPYVRDERFAILGAEKRDLPAILAQSDVVSLHCNLTEETRLIIDESALAAMRPTAILINTSRGPTVDEEALLKALEEDRLYAAGLDVFWDEPPRENRDDLLAHPHVIASGHYAWFSDAAMAELQRRAGANMAAMLRGEVPEDCLNPEAFAPEG